MADRQGVPGNYVLSLLVDVDDFEVTRLERGGQWAAAVLSRLEAVIRSAAGHLRLLASPVPPDAWSVTLFADDAAELEADACAYAASVKRLLADQGISVAIGVGGAHAGPGRLETAAREAELALERKLVDGGNEVYLHGDGVVRDPQRLLLPPERVEDCLARCIREADAAGAADVLLSWVERVSAVDGVTPDVLRRWVAAALLHAMDVAGGRRLPDGSTDWLAVCSRLSPDEMFAMFDIHERSYLKLWLERLLPRIVDAQAPVTPAGHVLGMVEKYIKDHYDEDLRLVTVGRAVAVSPYYISHLFQRERGTTFLKFLTSVRMQHGRRYLVETDLPVEAIAERVGYGAPKRFRVLFKRTFHVTPSEYRRQASLRRELAVAG